MNYALSPGGLLIHNRKDWPCAVCRPESLSENKGNCLCLDCAHATLAAAGAGEEGARALVGELAEALVLLEPKVQSTLVTIN